MLDKTVVTRLGLNDPRSVHCGGLAAPGDGPLLEVHTPIDGSVLATFKQCSPAQLEPVLAAAQAAFRDWRATPAPVRGLFVREFASVLREHKAELAHLVSVECGKILQEGLGEVQEMIDVCDFAVGLSRQLYGKTMPSERPEHRLSEQWHPLGPVGVISAFNFPVAVWSWNAAIAWVCGDPVVWKPSEKTPLCALACHHLALLAAARVPGVPQEVSSVVVGGRELGQALAASERLPLISATGSIGMGRAVAQTVAQRLGRSLLELGGNNAIVVTPSADLELALRAIVFAAAGTAGQRCTSLRRLIVHRDVHENLVQRLVNAFASLPVGNPLEQSTLVGPLIDEAAFHEMQRAMAAARAQGATVAGGERVSAGVPEGGVYVRPAVATYPTALAEHPELAKKETFAPLVHVLSYETLDQAVALNNAVPQGLSSAIFTMDVQEAERFLSASGSDCGIVNVNIGTSGAEIGGAFGGEKETGGGRESGSDAWKAYMRRATNTVNYSSALPLAQGIRFALADNR